jgi:hypothetical protein
MDKLQLLKTQRLALRDTLRLSNSYRQSKYVDKFLQPGTKAPFKQSWAMMAHMHDLRVWTLTYAPSRLNNL